MYLLLSILCSSLINLIFRYFPTHSVDNQQAIAVNYWVCVGTGVLTSNVNEYLTPSIYEHSWAQYCIVLGLFFITVFFGMAVTAQKFGISVSVIAAKMGVVFPVLYAFIFLKEEPTAMLLIGIVVSLLGVYFVSKKDRNQIKIKSGLWVILLPALVLIGSGCIDLSLKIIELNLNGVPAEVPTILIFFSAAILGTLVTTIRVARKWTQLKWKNVFAGIILGVPNYFSIFFIFKALQSNIFQTSQVYPLNNIGIVLLSTILSVIIFREHLNRRNLIGISMAVVAIVLISWPF
ncbi:MAG: hypothetical protein JJ975_09595 [Bacteroidia bacterium]|nr:hypothetical protein [Bacteroidia bacterium]